MHVTVNKSALNVEQRGYPYRPKLEELLEAVSNSNPLLNFVCDEHCLTKDWDKELAKENGEKGGYAHYVYRVKVFQDGEELGSVRADTRYRRSIGAELVYGIESFRINKERGANNTTFTKDLKVALRTAKKAFVARASTELYAHIYGNVKNGLTNLFSNASNAVRWSLDTNTEAMEYAQAAYQAHKQGKTTVEMPVKLKSVRDYDDYMDRCDKRESANILFTAFHNKQGYAIKVMEDGKLICINLESNTVNKYETVEAMPTDITNKFVIFKVLTEHEAHAHLGVKLENNFFYVAQ
jgi:hypothetical protein